MRLTELDPHWLECTDGSHNFRSRPDANRSNGQGIRFLCPTCFLKNGGPIGTHSIVCWFADWPDGTPCGVPPDVMPGTFRWKTGGYTVHDLTLTPSIDGGPGHWHGFITNGEVIP